MKLIRLIVLLLIVAGLIWSVGRENHTVHSLGSDESKAVSGSEFIEATTVDGFIRKKGKLYDVYSLTPETASIKDCKT
jgi:hypothetical protein